MQKLSSLKVHADKTAGRFLASAAEWNKQIKCMYSFVPSHDSSSCPVFTSRKREREREREREKKRECFTDFGVLSAFCFLLSAFCFLL